ncbi:MAG: hypothetical protein VXZ52_04165 [Candidatus Thermoplasmatota archaeon]|nr:hypothetical protein [Candidatus Thermoplasmatota archaeon]
MQPISDDIGEWCDETWGQNPLEILEWFEDDETVQVFIKLPRSVLVADFTFKENAINMDRDRVDIKHHLHIPLDIWNPGSIQATRINDGRVRFRHRNSDIILAAKMRAPEWGKTVLEDWLMSLRGEQLRPRDRNQRLAAIKRTREIVGRNIHSASLAAVRDDLMLISQRINSAETGLNPYEANPREAE